MKRRCEMAVLIAGRRRQHRLGLSGRTLPQAVPGQGGHGAGELAQRTADGGRRTAAMIQATSSVASTSSPVIAVLG